MVIPNFTTTSGKLANGETVHVNDHVYVSPPWSDRDGTPYTIARIIEFLPGNSTPKKGARALQNDLQVRLSSYYRPSDISGRNVSDFRQLLAAIHTTVEPLSSVRGKCHVRHRDKIEDLIAWKRNPDSFYFVKFFDPYIKREYEVVRTSSVNNIPPHVKEVLLQRYEYLVTEKEMVSDLLDTYRACCVCTQWAASVDSVRCEVCKQFYHMKCLTPPLAAKPAKGYSWACLACTIQRRKDVESEKYRFASNGQQTSRPAKGSTKNAKEKTVNNDKPDVTYRGWPWRYFGLYTNAEDTLDPDDQIFPRAVTRVGPRYQANVLSWEEQQEAEAHHGFGDLEAGPSRLTVERGFDPGQKKHESTLDVISRPSDELADYMADVARLNLAVPSHDVNRLDRAVSAFTTMGRDAALKYIRSLKLADFDPIQFDSSQNATYEAQLERYGGLEVHETGKVIGKRPAEVLRYHYIYQNKKLKLENEAIRQHRKIHSAHGRTSKILGPPSLGVKRSRADSEDSDDEVSLYSASFADENKNKLQCAACSTRISNVWWRCPRSVQGLAMCESCGSNYRKYGVISFVKAEDSKKETKKKGKNGDTASGTSTPVPPAPPKLPPCACCKKMEPKSAMARCKSCTFSAHSGCYGIAPEAMGTEWECELCVNARMEENYMDPRCVLCPRDQATVVAKIKPKKPLGDFDLLSALKPTEGCQWAHILCSAWIPECQYTNATTMKDIEGISLIASERFKLECSLCQQPDGAKISCAECEVAFHPSCAWQAGYKFGFHFALAKPNKREPATIAKFKDETGVMIPGCWCRSHTLDDIPIFDMHEIDPELNETALQIYTASYKTVPSHDSFPLLRKARRLDVYADSPAILTVQNGHGPGIIGDAKPMIKKCGSCAIDVSPRWYPVPGSTALLCHQCRVKPA